MNKKQLSKFVKDERKRKGWSQSVLVDQASLSRRQAVAELENCVRDYGIETLIKSLSALGYELTVKKKIEERSEYDFKNIESSKK